MDRLDEGANLNDIGSKVTILPSSHVGGPRYMKAKKQDALSIVRTYGKPTFFVTFTCNPEWEELKRDLPPGVSPANRPDFVARVFQLKLKELMKDLTERHVLGEMKAHTYVIEFQKRGLPHAHILIVATPQDGVNSTNADNAVKAVIPDLAVDRELYDLVLKHMIHKNCLGNENAVCHDDKGNCTKFFPKALSEITDLNDRSGYPVYGRHAMECIEGTPWDNTWVVPYNPWLLRKYQAHINVEICTSAKPVSYLYKYIYKGSDSADVSSTVTTAPRVPNNRVNTAPAHRNDNAAPVDEVKIFHDARWIGSCEAAWRILGLPIGEVKPAVTRLAVHLEKQQRVSFRPDCNHVELQENEKLRRTSLTVYFEMNLAAKKAEEAGKDPKIDYKGVGKDPRNYLYQDFPTHFVWSKKKRLWTIRKKGTCVGRMYFMSPKAGEVFYLRVLLSNRKGATSFDDIRTVDVQVEGAAEGATEPRLMTNKEACVALGLTDNDGEWHEAIKEATEFGTAAMLRGLLLTILLECGPAEPLKLWEKHKVA